MIEFIDHIHSNYSLAAQAESRHRHSAGLDRPPHFSGALLHADRWRQVSAFHLTAVKGGPEGLGGPGASFTEISSESDAGMWKVIFFWPKDFTFICPTEIAAFGKLSREFSDRDAVCYGVSTDSEFVHLNWRVYNDDIRDLPIPMLADVKRELSTALGILDKDAGVPLRATFIVDPAGTIMHVGINGLNVGRNPAETLRILDALQTDELCACNWTKGEEGLKPQELFKAA